MIDRENERIHERGKKKTEGKRNVCRINEGKIKREPKEGAKVKRRRGREKEIWRRIEKCAKRMKELRG